MFEVKKHLIKVSGNRLYLPVSSRLVWFRQEHPDWGIETKPIVIDTDKQYAVFEASVFNAEGKLMAKGTKMEDFHGFSDYIEKAETGAIGRALAVCGFGTQFAPDLEEVDGTHPIDAPIQSRTNGYSGGNGYGSRRSGGYTSTSQRPAARPPAAPSRSEPAAPHSHDHSAEADSSASPDSESAAADHACADCSRGLTKGQELLSVRKYGIALCPDCQKERRAGEVPA